MRGTDGRFYDSAFDLNRDGRLDAAEMCFMDKVIFGNDEEEEDIDYETDELEDAGLDRDELEWMDADERREVLEDAGLDPDDFDF